MTRKETIYSAIVAVLLLTGSGYLTTDGGSLPTPSAGIQDYGDWGTVTDHRTEIITSFWTDNSYPVGFTTGETVRIDYSFTLNGISLAEGSRDRISLPEGNVTRTQSTYLRTDRLASWWVGFLSANETLRTTVHGRIRITTPIFEWTYRTATEDTQFENRKPILDSISNAVERIEGRYVVTRPIDSSLGHRQVVVGADVRDARATWGSVDRNRTTLLVHFRIHNPSETVPLVVEPTGVHLSLSMNDVRLLRTGNGTLSPNPMNEQTLIAPGRTRDVTVAVTMDTDNIDDWFRTHVRNGERSDIDVHAQLVLDPLETGNPIHVPADAATYHCRMQTAILEDDRSTGTTCGTARSRA